MSKKKLSLPGMLLIIFSASVLFSHSSLAQAMPSFSMRSTNGTLYSSKGLPPGKPVILIYFAPDCDHCLSLMDAIFKRIHDFKKAQMVLVTFKPVGEVREFEKNYHISRYSNIKVGIETPIFFFRNYYQVENTPFTALFNRHRRLIISYKNQTPVDDLLKHLKVL